MKRVSHINARAQALCAQYELPEAKKRSVAARIRQAVAEPSGVRALRDIPRSEFKAALLQAQEFDRPGLLRRMAREAASDVEGM